MLLHWAKLMSRFSILPIVETDSQQKVSICMLQEKRSGRVIRLEEYSSADARKHGRNIIPAKAQRKYFIHTLSSSRGR